MKTLMNLVVSLMWFSAMALQGFAQETSGVGIALKKDGEDLVVNILIPDSPAARSHAIRVGDRIIAVAQEKGPDARVKGMSINEVVPLIRGPKGTSVTLTIVPAEKDDAQAYVVRLVRGELKGLAPWGDGALLMSGTKAPNILLDPLERQASEQLGDYAGKIVILEFWSISCGPCQGKMAELQSYPDKYPEWKDKVVLIGATNLDVFSDTKDAVIKHVKAKGWNKIHNVLVGAQAMKAYHVNALPTVYVIDQHGKVVDSSHALEIPTIVNRLVHGK
jgi:thiol-disulfide isomerase/thioredoxin